MARPGLTLGARRDSIPGMESAPRFIDVGEVSLCYDLMGSAPDPVIVLVSGLGSSLIGWDDEFCALLVSEGFRVLRFDNRDAGLSTRITGAPAFDLKALRAGEGTAAYTLHDMAGDVAGLLGALDIDSAHVVGRSMGGMIVQALAIAHPERVRSVCSIMSTTGASDVGTPTPEALKILMARPPSDRNSYVRTELANSRVIASQGALADDAWRAERFGRLFDRGIDPDATGRQIMAIVASGDRTADLGQVRAPTLVIHGDVDTLVTPSGGEATVRAIPGAELLVIPDMGHEVPPATFAQVAAAIVANARKGEHAPPGGRAAGGARPTP